MKLLGEVDYGGELCDVFSTEYPQTHRPCIMLKDKQGFPFAFATINLPLSFGHTDRPLIKDYAENEGILRALVKYGILEPGYFPVQIGITQVYVCSIHKERLNDRTPLPIGATGSGI